MDDTVSKSREREPRRVLLVSAGASHTVALLSGDLICSWGRGEDGQLGHGDADDRHAPTIVSSLEESEMSSVTCGSDYTTAQSDRRLIVYSWGCWGRNQNGQLGLGNTEDSLIPCTIHAFQGTPVKMIAAGGEHTAAVTESGKLYGWGWGRYGNLGLGDRIDRLIPGEVASVLGEEMNLVACGWRHTIAVSKSGTLYTYGWSKYGQLGHGDYEDHLLPHQVAALKGNHIFQISGGWRHTMALDDQGRLFGWGWNKFGQIGVGTSNDLNSPQLVKTSADEKFILVSCGWRHTVALTEKSNVYSWGRGTSGQLGHGDVLDRNLPKMIDALSADGQACAGIGTSQRKANTAANWIPTCERYAVVPDESVRMLASHLDQTVSVSSQIQHSLCLREDASGSDTDFKRIRTE